MIVDKSVGLLQALYGREIDTVRIEQIVIGVFFSGVKLSDGSGGIAYTPVSEFHGGAGSPSIAGGRRTPVRLKGMGVREVLAQPGGQILPDLVRLLVINALSTRFLKPDCYRIIYDADTLDLIDLENAGKTGMVGAFFPFLRRLKAIPGIDLSVIERKRESLKGDEMRFYIPADQAGEVLPRCDTVIITGASVANGTIDELLGYTRPGSKVVVTGPTASMLPDVLFESNVTVVSGVHVTDPDLALDMLSEAVTAYHLFDTCMRKINIVKG